MDSQLALIQSAVAQKLASDTFIRLRATANGQELVIEPLWTSQSLFAVRSANGERRELCLKDVPSRLEEFLSGAKQATIACTERNLETIIELQSGKVRMRSSSPAKQHPAATSNGHREAVVPGTRQTFIKAEAARELLLAIGIMSADGEIKGDKRRKYYQIDRFIELVTAMLESWPRTEELVVLDCGCGKSYLAFALNYYLVEVLKKKCRIIGIDSSRAVIESSRGIQKKLNYRNMEFHAAEVSAYDPHGPVHMVLSLHACDTATDQAMALGIRSKSRYIIAVPCCQSALTDELYYGAFSAVVQHNVFKRRLADLLTDGLRVAALEAHGYKVSVAEYVSPLDTPKNIMLRAERVAQDDKSSDAAYQELKRVVRVTPWIDRLLESR
ncbi:MAG: hypothetical protein DDT37_01131 [Firmicutes bacterium]|nr:hypothetical protein [candidate division NPL-UPA2 bacterium]